MWVCSFAALFYTHYSVFSSHDSYFSLFQVAIFYTPLPLYALSWSLSTFPFSSLKFLLSTLYVSSYYSLFFLSSCYFLYSLSSVYLFPILYLPFLSAPWNFSFLYVLYPVLSTFPYNSLTLMLSTACTPFQYSYPFSSLKLMLSYCTSFQLLEIEGPYCTPSHYSIHLKLLSYVASTPGISVMFLHFVLCSLSYAPRRQNSILEHIPRIQFYLCDKNLCRALHCWYLPK